MYRVQIHIQYKYNWFVWHLKWFFLQKCQ